MKLIIKFALLIYVKFLFFPYSCNNDAKVEFMCVEANNQKDKIFDS